jgi:hypothetical protein
MMYCFDSSTLVKRYAPEAGGAWVKGLGICGLVAWRPPGARTTLQDQ